MELVKRLAIITTHPIQYYAPVFKLLAKQDLILRVFYTWGKDSIKKYDPDFKKTIEWDIPLLDGYDFEFLENTSSKPGTTHFKGIVTPHAIQAINRFNPDAILVYGWSWHSHLQIIRHYASKKQIWFRGDSTSIDTIPLSKKIIRKILLTWVYRHIDLAFYVGIHNKKYFLQFGLKENQLRFSPHSIDNDRFSKFPNDSDENIREKLGLPHSGTLVLFAGKFEPKKDPIGLLKAFQALSNPNAFLLFVGNGQLEDELKDLVKNSSRPGHVFFMDFQNQGSMPAIYRASDLYCLPSTGPGETWGLAVNEAMASGKAVLVSSKVGCAPDLVIPGANGDIFEAGNVQALQERLEILTKDRKTLHEMGGASSRLIEKWSFQQQIVPILEEIQKL